jgi:hypothetical protein
VPGFVSGRSEWRGRTPRGAADSSFPPTPRQGHER